MRKQRDDVLASDEAYEDVSLQTLDITYVHDICRQQSNNAETLFNHPGYGFKICALKQSWTTEPRGVG